MIRTSGLSQRRGAVLVQVAAALMALLAVMALATDVSRLHIAAQRAQQVADSAAFAGGAKLPTESAARAMASGVASANSTELPSWPATVAAEDITYYRPGDSIYRPNGSLITTLGTGSYALRVQAHVTINFGLAQLCGLTSSTVMRYAVVMRGAASGMHIVPLWLAQGTPELAPDGAPFSLQLSDTTIAPIPGNFGLLDYPKDDLAARQSLMSGVGITDAVYAASMVDVGQQLDGQPGEAVGTWKTDLTSRLDRAAADWPTDTFGGHSTDNPRIILVPIVKYVIGTGGNACFEVAGFAAMWLLGVQGKNINVQFIEFHNSTGADGSIDPDAGGHGGVFVVRPLE